MCLTLIPYDLMAITSYVICPFLTDLSATKMYKITKDLCGPDEMP